MDRFIDSFFEPWPLSRTLLAVGLLFVGFALFVDGNLSEDWRTRLTEFLRTGRFGPAVKRSRVSKPWQVGARTLSHFFTDVLHSRSPRRFLKVSVAASALIIAVVFIYLFVTGASAAREDIFLLFSGWSAFWLAFIIPLIATLAIDVVASYQTIFFIEMVGKCRSLWQVLIIAYGNVLLSIALFSFVFPFVLVGLLLFEDHQTHRGKLNFQPVMTAQNEDSTRYALLFIFGRESYNNPKGQDVAKVGRWHIETHGIDREGKERTRHSVSVLTSSNLTADQILPMITDALKGLSSDIKVVEERRQQHLLNLPSVELEIEVRKVFAEIPLASLYRVAFEETNLFGSRVIQTVQGSLVSASSGGMIQQLATELQFSDALSERVDYFLLCDGSTRRIEDNAFGLAEVASKCSQWAAVSSALLKVQAAMITSQVSSKIMITPFALSSLSVTLLVYLSCFVLVYAAMVRALLPRFSSLNIVEISKIPLTISAMVAWVFFFLPLAILLTFVS